MDNASADLIRSASLPAELQLAVCSRYPDALARASELCEEVWFKLWPARPPISADRAEDLAARPLTPGQVDHVVDHESRTGPLFCLVKHNVLSSDQQSRLLAKKKLSSDVVEYLTSCDWFDPDLGELASVHLTGVQRLRHLVDNAGSLGPDRIAAALEKIEVWWGKDRSYAERSRLVDLLCNTVPGLVPKVVSPTMAEALRTPLAGSHLVLEIATQWQLLGLDPTAPDTTSTCQAPRFTQLALAWNPVAHDEVVAYIRDHGDEESRPGAARRAGASRTRVALTYREVEDPEQIRWLVQRCCSSARNFSGTSHKTRPFELVALAANKHLDDDQRRMVADDLYALAYDRYLYPHVTAALAGLDPQRSIPGPTPELHRRTSQPWAHESTAGFAPVELVEHTRTDQLRYSAPMCATAAHLAVTAFADDPERFVLFLQMFDRHKGEFKTLLETAKRL